MKGLIQNAIYLLEIKTFHDWKPLLKERRIDFQCMRKRLSPFSYLKDSSSRKPSPRSLLMKMWSSNSRRSFILQWTFLSYDPLSSLNASLNYFLQTSTALQSRNSTSTEQDKSSNNPHSRTQLRTVRKWMLDLTISSMNLSMKSYRKMITNSIGRWLKKKKQVVCLKRLSLFRQREVSWLQLRIEKVSSRLHQSLMITSWKQSTNQRFMLTIKWISMSRSKGTFFMN
jgi:hypothetical protein